MNIALIINVVILSLFTILLIMTSIDGAKQEKNAKENRFRKAA